MIGGNPLFVLYPKMDGNVKPPGGNITIQIVVENISTAAIYFSRLEVYPSWAGGKKGIKWIETKNYLPPDKAMFLTDLSLRLPLKAGLYTLGFGLETWVYNNYTTNWQNLGVVKTTDWGYIQVTPEPVYSVFVSQSTRPEDMPLTQRILDMIKVWGFEPTTLGINEFSEDPLRIPSHIKEQIDKADAVIAIATPRDFSVTDRAYKTFPWLHLETGIGFKADKPLLFIVDERIKSEGLLEYPQFPKVFYHPAKLDVLEHRLAVVMPGFRKWIAEKKSKDFFDALVKAGFILGGIYLVGMILKPKE